MGITYNEQTDDMYKLYKKIINYFNNMGFILERDLNNGPGANVYNKGVIMSASDLASNKYENDLINIIRSKTVDEIENTYNFLIEPFAILIPAASTIDTDLEIELTVFESTLGELKKELFKRDENMINTIHNGLVANYRENIKKYMFGILNSSQSKRV